MAVTAALMLQPGLESTEAVKLCELVRLAADTDWLRPPASGK